MTIDGLLSAIPLVVLITVIFSFMILFRQNESRKLMQEETNRRNIDLIIQITRAIQVQTDAVKETNRLQEELKEIFIITSKQIEEANKHYKEAIVPIMQNSNKLDKILNRGT